MDVTQNRFRIVGCLLIPLLAACSVRQSDPVLDRAILKADSTVQAAVDSALIPGAVLVVARNGVILHEKAYGYASLMDFEGRRLESPSAMTTDHVFDLASLTKVMATTFGMTRLVEAGDVDLDAPVKRYLPEFSGGGKDSVTVRHLLTHTGGLSPWRPVYYHARDAAGARRFVTDAPLAFPVGRARHYSDLGFMLLGYIIEEMSGKSIDGFVQDEIYGPLGLHSTAFRPLDRGIHPIAATSHGNPFEKRMVADDGFGYRCDEDPDSFADWRQYTLVGEVNDGNAYYAHEGIAGHAGLFSTARELTTLMTLLIDGGLWRKKRVISERIVREFLTPGATGNGLGWVMSRDLLGIDSLPAGAFAHTGFTGTYVLGLPSERLSVVLLTNRQNLGVGPDTRYNNVNPLRREVASHIVASLKAR